MQTAFSQARLNEKRIYLEESDRKKTAYIGAGAGLVLFALFGLLPGSLLGGAMGINIAGWIFGLPLQPGLPARIIVLALMLTGVLVSGIAVVTVSSMTGWLAGRLLEAGLQPEEKSEKTKTE